MFHGRKSYRDEEFIKLFQGRLVFCVPAEERFLALISEVENFAFCITAKYRNFLFGSFTNYHGKTSMSCFFSWISVLKSEATIEVKFSSLIHSTNTY